MTSTESAAVTEAVAMDPLLALTLTLLLPLPPALTLNLPSDPDADPAAVPTRVAAWFPPGRSGVDG